MNKEQVAKVLREHWLTGTECDKEDRTNAATCFCSTWRSEISRSPCEAVEHWIAHVLSHLPADRNPAQTEADAAFDKALQAADVPRLPLEVYDSNSYRRVGLQQQYQVVMEPCTQRDGHPDIRGTGVLRALVAAFNAMLLRSQFGRRREIATVRVGFAGPVDTEQREAALLIAAAPELLAALQNFEREISLRFGSITDMSADLRAVVVGARAAITKATSHVR